MRGMPQRASPGPAIASEPMAVGRTRRERVASLLTIVFMAILLLVMAVAVKAWVIDGPP